MYDNNKRVDCLRHIYQETLSKNNISKIFCIDRKTLWRWLKKGIISLSKIRNNNKVDALFAELEINKHKNIYEPSFNDFIKKNIESSIENYNSTHDKKKIFTGKKIYRNKLITPEIEKYICDFMKTDKIANTRTLFKNINDKFKIKLKKSSLYFILHNNGYVFKKTSIDYKPTQNLEKYKEIKKEIVKNLNLDNSIIKTEKPKINRKGILEYNFDKTKIKNIICIDETGNNTIETNNKTWIKKGTQKVISCDKKYGLKTSTVIAISADKLIGHKTKTKSFNGQSFFDFFDEINQKVTNSFFFMDNAKIHKCKLMKAYIEDKNSHFNKNNNKIIFNVPYSPENNPVELINNILKTELKFCENDTVTKLTTNIENCLNNIDSKIYLKIYNCAFSFLYSK